MPGRDNPVSLEARGAVGPAGGVVGSKNGEINVVLPAGAINAPGTLLIRDRAHPRLARKDGTGVTPLVAFDVELSDASGRKLAVQLGQDAIITLDYSKIPLPDIHPRSLTFFTLNEATNRWEPAKTEPDLKRKKLVVRTQHFSGWAVAGDREASLVPSMEAVQTRLFTRSAEISIDLKLPPGLPGILPKLTLRYNSNAVNRIGSKFVSDYDNAQASWVGLGWSLDLGMITVRAAVTGHQMFAMNFGGVADRILKKSPVNPPDHYGQYYLQNEAFHKITHESSPKDHWLAIEKDGTKHRFGYLEGAGENDPHPTNTGNCQDGMYMWPSEQGTNPHLYHLHWLRDRIEDTNGNVVTINYEGTRVLSTGDSWNAYYDRSVYPKEILWNDRSGQPRFKVVFNRTEGQRQDIPGSGYMYETAVLNSIEMWVNSSDPYNANAWQRVRRYQFNTSWVDCFNKPRVTRKHLVLNSIQEYGSDNTSSPPAWTFQYQNRYLRWNSSPFNQEIHAVPFLTEVNNGYGGKVTFTYALGEPGTTYLTDGEDPDTVRWHVVTTRKTYDKVSGGYQEEGYSATRAYFYTAENPSRPFFRGFNVVTVTDNLNTNIQQEHRFFQGTNGAQRTRSDGTNLTDSEGLVGREYETLWKDGSNVLRKQWSTYHQATWAGWMEELPPGETPDNTIYFSAPNDIRDFQGTRSKKQTIDYEDVYGNWISKKEFAGVNDTQWYRHTKQAFASSPNTADWIVGKPRWVNIYEWDGSADGRWKSSTSYYYDGNSHLPPGTPTLTGNNEPVRKPGNLRAVRRARRESEYVYKYFDAFYDYDTYGNKVVEKVRRGWGDDNNWGSDEVVTQWNDEDNNLGYDKLFHTFPKHVDNALGQRTTHTFDPKWGLPTAITDPNNATVTRDYDVFGRPKRVWQPDDTVGTPAGDSDPAGASLLQVYVHVTPFDLQAPFKTETFMKKAGTDYHKTRTFFDGLGREVQRYSDEVEVGGVKWVIINTHYSNRGLKEWKSVPYFLNSTPLSQGNFDSTAWSDTTKPRSQYGWDALRRPTTVTNPDGTQRNTSYDGWDIILVDEKSHKKVQKMDAFGRLTAVEEYTGTNPWTLYATTNYGYDVLDNLTTVTNAANNTTTITWNELSRKTAMSDPDMGNWSYVQDGAGNLISQTDAKGQTIIFTRDVLGRPTRKYYPKEWVDHPLTTNHSPGVYDLMELRASIDVDRLAAEAPLGPYNWSNPAIVAGRDVTIRALHFNEMRSAIQELWTQANIGTVPGFTRGSIQADPPRLISLQDPTDLRGWLHSLPPATNYETSSWAGQNGRRARAVYRWDNYTDNTYNPGNAVGRRTEMWDASGHTRWTWDARGRIIKEEKWIDGQIYITDWTYDAMDRVVTMKYPDGEVVTYTYNNQLLLSSMSGSVVGSIISDLDYNALDLPTQVKLPNAVSDLYLRNRYYGSNLDYGVYPYGALWDIRLEKTGSNLLRLEHGYDYARNITRTIETPNYQDFTFVLDDLDRVTARQITGGANQETFGYNMIGNITSKNGAPYTYGSKPHAVTSDGANPYGYDNNGNMTQRGTGQYIKYDAENRPVKVSSDVGGAVYIARFACDGDGRRVKRLDNYGTIHYVGAHYERNVGTGADTAEVISKFYYAQMGRTRRLIAFRRGGTLYYVVPDHLGGTLSVRDTQGNEVGWVRYHAFGADRSNGGTLYTDKKFTGQTLDMSSGLYYYGARYYDAYLNRWISPQSVEPDPGNARAPDRYSYEFQHPGSYL